MNSVAIVTAIAGNYDHHRDDVLVPNADHYFFTDEESKHLCREWWHRVELPGAGLHPRLRAKGPKINPYQFDFLRKYHYVIWVDGGCSIQKESFAEELLSHLKNGMVVSPHFDGRHDAYGEATIRSPKYAEEPLDEQVAYYRRMGFPENFGLYETGIAARNMRNTSVRSVSEFWERQVHRWSIQDQVSLPFSLWHRGYRPDVLPKSFRDYGWVIVNAHKSEA